MDDTELDIALARLDRATETPRELEPLVTRTRAATRRRRVTGRARRGLFIGAGIGLVGATAFAGVNYQEYLLSIPPFVGLEDGTQRATTPLVVHPPTGGDGDDRCLLYPEFRGLDAAQLAAVEALLSSTDGDALAGSAASEPDPVAYGDAVVDALIKHLQTAVPELSLRGAEPLLAGYSMTCRDDAPDAG